MDVDIRKYIKGNFKDSNEEEIKSSIVESIRDKDEITLPGLGVFFEILWTSSNDSERNNIIKVIKNNLN